MASDPYQGPVSLGASMYASLQRNTATFPSSPAAIPVPSTPNSPIAAKEQVAATASTNEPDLAMAKVLNPDTQLAFAQNVALKEDVAKHIAQFGKSVRTAVENTHRLLNLIRDSIKQDDPAAAVKLQTVDNLWAELEYLFKAADNAKIALPEFLVKHEENMGLYHASMLNETIQNSQAELNLQHKKVNIQHSLTLSHQQAFLDYKERTDSKLAELGELQERVKRLQMEQGLFKDEVKTYKGLLDEANTSHKNSAKTADDLQQELSATKNAQNDLATENKTLGTTIEQLQESLKTAQRRVTMAVGELARRTEDMGKKAQEQTSLRTMVKALQTSEGVVKKEAEDLKGEYKNLQEKFKNQGSEYSKLFTKSNASESKINALGTEISSLKQENGSLKSRLEVHAGLEKTKQSLVDVNHRLEQKVKTLEVQVDNFDEKNSKAMKETELLRGKVKELEKKNEEVEKYDAELKKYNGHLEKYNDELKKHIAELEKEKTKLKKENDDLETDNNALAGNAAEHKKSLLGLNVLKEENAKLRAIIEELQKKPVVTTTAPADEGALKDLQKKLRESQEKLLESKENTTKLEASLQEWTELATRSYEEYKKMLPTYNQAEAYRNNCFEKDKEIQELKRDLRAAKAWKQKNGSGMSDEAVHWKDRYDALLASVSD